MFSYLHLHSAGVCGAVLLRLAGGSGAFARATISHAASDRSHRPLVALGDQVALERELEWAASRSATPLAQLRDLQVSKKKGNQNKDKVKTGEGCKV